MTTKAAIETYIAAGEQKMRAALAEELGKGFRPDPTFDDLIAVGRAMLRHLVESVPQDPELREEAPTPKPADVREPEAPQPIETKRHRRVPPHRDLVDQINAKAD